MLEARIFHFYYTTLKINDFLRFKAARFSMTNYPDAQDRENGINSATKFILVFAKTVEKEMYVESFWYEETDIADNVSHLKLSARKNL